MELFTVEQRAAVRDWLLDVARADDAVVGAAFTGSHGTASADRWSEVDVTFATEGHLGPRGPQWRLLFGEPRTVEPFAPPGVDALVGHGWHHAWHAWICLRRGRAWQAETWINALRGCVVTLACVRLGLPWTYAKGAHLLPGEVTDALEPALVRSLEEPELRRALGAAVAAFAAELERSDPESHRRLGPMLSGLTASPPHAGRSGPGPIGGCPAPDPFPGSGSRAATDRPWRRQPAGDPQVRRA